MSVRTFLRNNGLSVVIFSIFFLALVGMSIVGYRVANNELEAHQQPEESYVEYLGSGDFVEAVFENWESEFLQMWALVVLTVYLRQKGSEDSKPMRGKAPQDTSSRYSIINSTNWRQREKATKHFFYSHSLDLALISLFLMSLILHAVGGAGAYNDEQLQHGEQTVSVIGYLGTSQFWFESLQNWQSEFLAAGTLIVLSIFLRERGSQQSKPVGKRYNHKTGE